MRILPMNTDIMHKINIISAKSVKAKMSNKKVFALELNPEHNIVSQMFYHYITHRSTPPRQISPPSVQRIIPMR